MTYFHRKYNRLSSAQRRFTVLFGMGRSGTTLLWPSGIGFVPRGRARSLGTNSCGRKDTSHTGCSHILYFFLLAFSSLRRSCLSKQHGYGIKPHGQLVPVSFTPHSASTPGLSTSWSRTTLQGGLASGKTHLQASFPLRCFQRLSLPHIATRQCDWRHNRYTRGASTPVLSY